MEIKDRFTCTFEFGFFPDGSRASKARALLAAGNTPDPVWKILGGGDERLLKGTQPNPESYEHTNK